MDCQLKKVAAPHSQGLERRPRVWAPGCGSFSPVAYRLSTV